uniref:Uncharacterized protein n=1 Tax=Octopus bimaculoides TaxID=37653 RepID=A0A0L8H6T0_OCTBM
MYSESTGSNLIFFQQLQYQFISLLRWEINLSVVHSTLIHQTVSTRVLIRPFHARVISILTGCT